MHAERRASTRRSEHAAFTRYGRAARVRARILVWVLAFASLVVAGSGQAQTTSIDRGLLFEVDREAYEVRVTDLKTGEQAEPIRVAVGSPAHPTPLGAYVMRQVVLDPDWHPGPTARRFGAEAMVASPHGPLGIAKIPFQGAYSLHGGGGPFAIGKPVTLGCLRASDRAIGELLNWMAARQALAPAGENTQGERPQRFIRPARIVIR